MDNNFVYGHTLAGTIGGTLLVLLVEISYNEIWKTALLAAIGAAVSFGVSLILKRLTKRFNRKQTIFSNNKKQNNG